MDVDLDWFCIHCHEPHHPHHRHHPQHRRLILGYADQGAFVMASTPLDVPAGTTTVYASVDNYVDASGAPTTDVAVSGTWTADNGATVAPDGAGLTATVTIVAGAGTTVINFSGQDAAGNTITGSNSVVEAAAAPNPAVTADVVLSTTPPTPAAVPAVDTGTLPA